MQNDNYILESVLVYLSAPAATLHAAGCELHATLTVICNTPE
jgi:hypothetical protein